MPVSPDQAFRLLRALSWKGLRRQWCTSMLPFKIDKPFSRSSLAVLRFVEFCLTPTCHHLQRRSRVVHGSNKFIHCVDGVLRCVATMQASGRLIEQLLKRCDILRSECAGGVGFGRDHERCRNNVAAELHRVRAGSGKSASC